MKKSFGTKMKVWALGALSIVASGAFTGCSDEIPEESRFTFTGELIADHLKNNPDKYKNFCEILKKAKINKKGGIGSLSYKGKEIIKKNNNKDSIILYIVGKIFN